jgi:hypothetical protein
MIIFLDKSQAVVALVGLQSLWLLGLVRQSCCSLVALRHILIDIHRHHCP